jgi:hypothetical protein
MSCREKSGNPDRLSLVATFRSHETLSARSVRASIEASYVKLLNPMGSILRNRSGPILQAKIKTWTTFINKYVRILGVFYCH